MQDIEKRRYPRIPSPAGALSQVRLRLVGDSEEHRVSVRNLSPRGVMAVGAIPVACGSLVQVELGSVGWVAGAVAWVEQDRCGIAFGEDIDIAAI